MGYKYYSFDRILSLNAVLNFILGGRGIGKTFGAKLMVIRKHFKTGEQFIYVRRYKDELRDRDTFFADIAHMFPDVDFRVNGSRAEWASVESRDDKKRTWTTLGYFVALSTAQQKKGVSYPLVKWIIYDEFILEAGFTRYIPSEAHSFLNFYSTVDRGQDRVRVLFLANTVSIDNPYFIEYKIRPDQDGMIGRKYGGFVAYHFPDSEAYKNRFYETRFGQFVKGTTFGDFAMEAKFADGHSELVEAKQSDAKYYCTLELREGTVSVWSKGGGHYHVQEKRPGNEKIFTLDPKHMGDSKTLVVHNDKIIQLLRTAFRHARITFDSPESRNRFLGVFKR